MIRWIKDTKGYRPMLGVLVGTIVSLAISYGFVELVSRLPTAKGTIKLRSLIYLAGVVVTYIGSYLVPALLVVYGLVISFRQQSKRGPLLAFILLSYFSLVLAFAGLYYSMCAAGDYHDAVHKYIYYKYEGIKLRVHLKGQVLPIQDERAFSGIKQRLYSGTDWPLDEEGKPTFEEYEPVTIPVEDLLKGASGPDSEDEMYRVVKSIPSARIGVFMDCLYFSVVTMTTAGYGDIVPKATYSKLAASIQVLTGLCLFVVALGMLFGNWKKTAT